MSCPMSGMNNSEDFQKRIDTRLHNKIRRDFKQVFLLEPILLNTNLLKTKIESTHVFKKSKSGKIHLVHKITSKAFCSFKIKTFEEEINILLVDEKDICIRCIQLYNTFREKK